MRNTEKRRDILDLKIGKSVKYTAAAFSGAFMHLTFLVIFAIIQLYVMVIYNVFSVGLYIVLGMICKRENFERRAYNWISAIYFEIALHSFFCTLFLGVNTCFFLYTMMTIPVMLYYLFLTCEKKMFKRGTLLFSLCSLAFLGAALVFDHFCDPFFYTFRRPLTLNETDLMRTINIAFNIVLLFGFSTLFILEIHNLINKLNETNDRLNYIATHDALTGLYNRHSLTGALSALKTSERPFCIVMGDLDDFKKVNDTYGHECGDVVLKSVSEVILRNMGGGNTACRWGGEEILMIMYGSAMDCFHTISRIKAQINDLKITHDGTPVKVSMTFGFAASGESGSQDIDAMLSTVDKRLYKGKASGKNVIIVE